MRMDVRRMVQEVDTIVGGVTITSTAVETREIELQNLRGEEIVALGGMRLEANYKGFTSENSTIREGDIVTPDSGTTRYEVVFVKDLLIDHVEFFAKKAS